MATNKQPPGGFSIDDAIAEALDSAEAVEPDPQPPELRTDTQRLDTIELHTEEADEWGSETRVIKLPAEQKTEASSATQNARLQPLPRGVSAELDFGNQRFQLKKSLTIIGRVKDVADIALVDDDQLSRHHAAIVYADGGFYVEDLDSTNGTFIGSKRIKRALLSGNVEVTVGRHVFRLVVS